MENTSANVNDLKEALRYVEAETENLTRYLSESKRLSVIDGSNILPFGTLLFLTGVFLCLCTYGLFQIESGVLPFSLSLIFAVILTYAGIKTFLFGLKMKNTDRKVKTALNNAQEYRKELEQRITEALDIAAKIQ